VVFSYISTIDSIYLRIPNRLIMQTNYVPTKIRKDVNMLYQVHVDLTYTWSRPNSQDCFFVIQSLLCAFVEEVTSLDKNERILHTSYIILSYIMLVR